MAKFLEARGLPEQALSVATDPDYRFELAVRACCSWILQHISKVCRTGCSCYKTHSTVAMGGGMTCHRGSSQPAIAWTSKPMANTVADHEQKHSSSRSDVLLPSMNRNVNAVQVQLGELEVALDIATASAAGTEAKWKQLGELAMSSGRLDVRPPPAPCHALLLKFAV